MPAQERLSRSGGGDDDFDAEEFTYAQVKAPQSGDVDDILADIDSVLESNAETFVRSFVQKGGE
ncbi:ubiquitin-like protein Pup [Micrococcales bacterium 31B]|nr:ubiquitin-like protein Pup [Micrococcales bacterium 31B]